MHTLHGVVRDSRPLRVVLLVLVFLAGLMPRVARAMSFDSLGLQTDVVGVQASAQSIGIGGGGAMFEPAISPHYPQTFISSCDMGGIFVTHDAGNSWKRHELYGRTYALAFDADPARKGYVYAGGSALARSKDNGDTWELIWPNPADIEADPTSYEDIRHLYYNRKNWPTSGTVRAIAVDGGTIYALVLHWQAANNWNRAWELFKSADDGASFTSLGIAAYDSRGIEEGYSDVRLLVLGGVPYVFMQAGAYKPADNPSSSTSMVPAYEPDGTKYHAVVSADLMADGRIAVAEALSARPASGTYRPHTSLRLFEKKDDGTLTPSVDLTSELETSTQAFSLDCDRYNGDSENGNPKPFSVYISRLRTSGQRVYFINVVTLREGSSGNGLLGLYDFEKAADEHLCWVYGFPQMSDFWKLETRDSRHFDEYDIVDRGHCDAFYGHWGLACDPSNPKAFLLATGGGCAYSPDCDFHQASGGNWPSNRSNIRQLYTTSPQRNPDNIPLVKDPLKDEYTTTGIDELTSYGLRQDPFDANHLAILYTDVGLWTSRNGGASWHKSDTATKMSSNVYDLTFDQYVRDRAYAVWSSQHDAPYNKSFANGGSGGFACSTDGGETWERIGSGLPARIVPMRMSVVYPADEGQRAAGTNRTMWLATFGRGFWRSDDAGQSFTEVNDGVSTMSDGLILGADIVASADGTHVFALTTRGTSDAGVTQGGPHGRVYEWDAEANAGKGAWRAIAWPEGANVECPKTLFWDEARSTLYASCVAAHSRDTSKRISIQNFGGGLYSYHLGDASFVAVDEQSDAVGRLCSVEGCTVDEAGNLFVSDLRGSVFVRRAGTAPFVKLYDGFHLVSKDIQLVSETTDAEGAQDDVLALPTFGGGLLRLRAHVQSLCQTDGHVWGQVTYTWSDDLSTCTARRVCERDASHVEEETVTADSEVTRAPTCMQKGETTYTAAFANPVFQQQTRVAENLDVDAEAHDWGEWKQTEEPTLTTEGEEQRVCKHNPEHIELRKIAPLGHVHGLTHVEAVAATCTEPGSKEYWKCDTGENPCGRLFADAEATQELKAEDIAIPALGHNWGAWEQTKAPTCVSVGEAQRVCASDPTHVEKKELPVDQNAHDWDEGSVTVQPTCAEQGTRTHTCRHDASHKKTEVIPALGHDWGPWEQTKAPTQTEEGEERRVCKHGPAHVETRAVAKLNPEPDSESESESDPSQKPSYHLTDGDKGTWKRGTKEGLSFTFKRSVDDALTFGRFTGIRVDGKDVDAANYDAVPGSVEVTLHANYLGTLAVGQHELRALFSDGDAVAATFTVEGRHNEPAGGSSSGANNPTASTGAPSHAQTVPNTADSLSAALPLLLLCAGAVAIAVSKRWRAD